MKNLFLLLFSLFFVYASAQPCKTVVGYYPVWQWYDRANLVRPATIDYSKYSIINYAFLKPLEDGSITITDPWSDKNLLLGTINWSVAPAGYDTEYDLGNAAYHNPNTSLISYAHNANVKVMMSIGGFTLSYLFPAIAADPVKRTNFAHWCNEIIRTYDCDGIDIDWEYPGDVAQNGTPADTENFTLLIHEIRDSLNALEPTSGELMLTSAFSASPERMQDIEWNNVLQDLDFVNLMSYDFFGTWDAQTNHNSPLFAPTNGNPDFNLASAVHRLIDEYNVPSQKINAGVAFYGRSAVTTGTPDLFAPSAGYADAVTFSTDLGIPQYYNVLQQWNLFESHWDDVAHVPYLTGLNDLHTFVSYDDEASINEKGHFIVNNDLAGAIIWEITGDYIETFPGSGIIESTPLASALNEALCSLPSVPLDCEHMCVTDISFNPETNLLDVTIVNGSEQINYPTVVVIINGDTVANIGEQFFFFAQLPGETVTHTISTTLTDVPPGFECMVTITDVIYDTFCILEYPCIPDAINEQDNKAVLIFPNPVSTLLNLQSEEWMKNYTIRDLSGRIIESGSLNSTRFQLDTNPMSTGFYTIEILMEDGTSSHHCFEK